MSTTTFARVGALIRAYRSERGLSQLDLALAAGTSSRHLSFIETGRANPSREMVLALAAAATVQFLPGAQEGRRAGA